MSSQPTTEQARAPENGVITWTEIPATDIDRVSSFYSKVFGWSSKHFPALEAGQKPFFMIFEKGCMHGGFAKVEPENHLSPAKHPDNAKKERRAVNVTISVESIEETMKLVEQEGGALYHEKKEIPGGMGFVAYFTDSEGNVMGLWASK